MLRHLSVLLCLSAQVITAQVSMPATTRVGIEELRAVARKTDDAAELTRATQGHHPTALIHGRCMVGFIGRVNGSFDAELAQSDNVRVGSRKGNILSFRVDAYHLDAVNSMAGLEYAELAGKVAPSLNKVVKDVRADSVQQGINLPQTYTGREVLIGVLDWGFDYTHPMFYDTALTATRVRAAWDQFRQAGPAPGAFGYGTELTTTDELLAMQADTANIYSYATHGSHVAGIAGGGGAGTVYRGIAFDARFVFCTFLVDAAAVLDAFAWMQSIADQDQKRLVVNMSWGLYYMGTLDGNSLISQAINAYAVDGITFVNSGGNNGDVNFHIKKDFASDTMRTRIGFYPYDAHPAMWGQSITMWGDPGASFSTELTVMSNTYQVLQESPWYHTAVQPAYLDSFLVTGNDTVFFNLTAEAAHPLNGRPHFRLRVKNTNTSLRIVLKATASSGTVHFWNVTELTNGVGNWGQPFIAGQVGWTVGDAQYGISEPACTEGLLTVAAYRAEYLSGNGTLLGGEIASFSSIGPTMDGRMKPDIAAPGVSVASSISSFTDNDYTAVTTVPFMGRDYPFARFSGTSMSAPAVTGIVALMLEADPTLSPADIKEVLKLTARTDADTGILPPEGSTQWGKGKVNAYHAVRQILGLTSVQEQEGGGMMMWPNPVSSDLYVSSGSSMGAFRITVVDVTGRTMVSRSSPGGPLVLDVRAWPTGVYVLRFEQQGGTAVQKVLKH